MAHRTLVSNYVLEQESRKSSSVRGFDKREWEARLQPRAHFRHNTRTQAYTGDEQHRSSRDFATFRGFGRLHRLWFQTRSVSL